MRRWTPRGRCCFFLGLAGFYFVLHIQYANFSIPWLRLHPAAHPRALLFIAGILVYEIQSFAVAAALRKLAPIGVLAGLAAYYILQTNPWAVSHLRTSIWSAGTLGVAYSCLVLNCAVFQNPLSRAFSWAPLRFAGTISYSYYLIHGPALHGLRLVIPPGAPPLFLLPLALGVTLIAAPVLFALVEKPLSFGPQAGRGRRIAYSNRKETL